MFYTDTSTSATIAAIHAALDATDVFDAYTGLAEAGLRPLWVKSGSKVPAEKPEVGVTDPRRGGGWLLAARDATDAAAQVRAVRRRADQRGTPNLALVPDGERVVMLDFDTPAEVAEARALWQMWGGDPAAIDSPTVSTPGKQGEDGTWQHRDGGHLWIALPADADVDLTSLGSTINLTGTGEAPRETGRDSDGRQLRAPSAALKLHSGYALIPPSARPEGEYVRTGDVVPAPAGMIAWLRARVADAERERLGHMEARERRAAERKAAEARGEVAPLAGADAWAASTPWEAILGDLYGWTYTRESSCGCEEWQRPGGSPRSAIAHDPGCTAGRYAMDHDHGPVHLFTDNPDPALAEMRDFRASQGVSGKTLTKLEVTAAFLYAEHPVESRVSRMLDAHGWATPACVTALADLAGKGHTARAAQAAVSSLPAPPVATPMEEKVNEEPTPAATTPAGVTAGVTAAVTEAATQPVTEAGTQSATPRGTRRLLREAPLPTVAPTDTPDVRALRDEFEYLLDRELEPEQVQHLADLLASNASSAHTIEGPVRDEAWGGYAPAWSPNLVAYLMSKFEFTRQIFWWAQTGELRVHPVTLTLLALQAMSRELPVSLQAPSHMPGVGSPLSTYIVAVGASGSGKNLAQSAALDWARGSGFILSDNAAKHTGLDPASPVAMAEPMMRQVDVTSADDVAAAEDAAAEAGKKRGPQPVKWTMQPDPVGCYVIDELSALFTGNRLKMGMPQALCSAWSEVNFLPASMNNGNRTVGGRFRVTLVGGLQPAQSAKLLDTSGLGLIQRVIMAPVIWPGFGVLDERDVPRPAQTAQTDQVAVAGAESRWPGIAAAIRMGTVGPSGVGTQTARGVIFPAVEKVIKAMKAEAVAAASPDAGADTDSTAAMMTHATQTTIRIATLVAIADGASCVTWDHWSWAWSVVNNLHAATLAHAVAGSKAARAVVAAQLGEDDAARRSAAEAKNRSVSEAARDAILAAVREAGDEGISVGAVTRSLSGPQRHHRDPMIDALVAAGHIRAEAVPGGRRLYPAAPSADGVIVPITTLRPAPGATGISMPTTDPTQPQGR